MRETGRDRTRPGARGATRPGVSSSAAEERPRRGGGEAEPRGVARGPFGPRWPIAARRLVSAGLIYHLAALLAGALGAAPSSELQQAIAEQFSAYFGLMDLGYSYRFYAEPPPTPVVSATLRFDGGRDEERVRLPGRNVPGPRLRQQRQLALANALFNDVYDAKVRGGDASKSLLARAYARHLCRSRPGCREVVLHVQQHLVPDPVQAREAMAAAPDGRLDLFEERWFTTPEWIGDYSCASF